ncbi:PDGLE domain-containing protein [Halocatena marina]|uniref:Metal transporter n=1 Tax=Halocatena marina TaxID=2934937 RepID=A0ABD5YSR9_9EURY|nr:PDGLE domain-containing protein [Halocatena marina]
MSSERTVGFVQQQWARRSVVALTILAACAPVFAWATEQTGYTEPLDIAAELTGASAYASPLFDGVVPGYSIPGLDAYTGTLIVALLGTGLTLIVTVGIGSILEE